MANNKTEKILSEIFKGTDLHYGLKVFSSNLIKKLKLKEEKRKYFVFCLKRQQWKLAKPEEIIRQLMLIKLTFELNYEIPQIDIEVPVKMGSTYASKKADIIVYKDEHKSHQYIIIELKKPKRKDGLEQLHSYINATGVWWGGWINGNEENYQYRREPNIFETVSRLPAINEDVDDVLKPLKKSDLKPIQNLKEEIQDLENTVLAAAGVNAFEEIFKLIITKLHDEFDKSEDDYMDFRTTTAPPKVQYDRINGLFQKVIKDPEWDNIFNEGEKIELTPEALITIVSEFSKTKFSDTDLDVIDAAFEYMINPEQKSDKGQFFTPRPIVKMCVKMLNPQIDELCLDPACGPCGFMIHTLNWVSENYIKKGSDYNDRRHRYARSMLYAIDYDQKLTRVARAMMLIAGDGKTNVYRVSSLDPREWKNRDDGLGSKIKDGKFSIVMTNPPFAGDIKQPEILGSFDLAYKGDSSKNKRVNNQTRDVLFIERCLRFLKPGGRLAIVLPQGIFNGTNLEYVRNYIFQKARILSVVGLHQNTFKPFAGVKASVLFLQKYNENEEPLKDYPIFMAVNKNPVKDNSGDYIYKKKSDGTYEEIEFTDQHGHKHKKRIIADDLDEIAEEFKKFAKKEKFDFWK